jgi:hypothetical protein
MFGLLKKLLVCSILLVSVIASYGETPTTSESKEKQAARSDKTAQQQKQDAAQSSAPVKIAPPTESDQKPKQVPEQDDNHPTPDWWLIGITGLLTIATSGLVYYARDTARRQLRAYVGCQNISIVARPIRGQFAIKNFGQTMAKEVEIRLATAVETVGTTQFNLEKLKCKTVIMPGEVTGWEEEAGEYDSGLMNQGVYTIYAWGRVDYKDVFGRRHWTTFRFESDGIRGTDESTGMTLRHWKVKTCKEGNDAE